MPCIQHDGSSASDCIFPPYCFNKKINETDPKTGTLSMDSITGTNWDLVCSQRTEGLTTDHQSELDEPQHEFHDKSHSNDMSTV